LSPKDRPAPPQPPLATSTAERLAAIVEAAEQAAVTVIDDAERQAQRQLEQARTEADRVLAERLGSLTELTNSLIAQAEAIQAQSQQLLASLADAKRRIGAEGGAEAGDAGPTPIRGSHLSAVEPAAEPSIAARFSAEQRGAADENSGPSPAERRGAVAPEDSRTPAGARLLATQMAVSGNTRKEIEERLRNGFEIEDTASILDAILGPEE
jgi:cell division septum initiation protein DivIVA